MQPLTLNRYAYTANNPLMYQDPSGHSVIKLGSRGQSVKELQQLLISSGYNGLKVDGIFGKGTLSAVKAYQTSKGLTVDGIVGSQTWGALRGSSNPTLRKGSRGGSVTKLQQGLLRLDYDLGPYGADGVFGNQTEKAVKDFQRKNGLDPDGIVGKQTWAALAAKKVISNNGNDCGGSNNKKGKAIVLTENEKKLGIKVATIDGKQYYDYSEPINKMINDNTKICFDHRLMSYEEYLKLTWYQGSYTDWLAGVTGTMWWFRDQVTHKAPWDIKRKERWEEQLKGVKYLGIDGQFVLYGQKITSEDLGNITYGYWGSVVGFGDVTIYWGGGPEKSGITNPETKKPPYYGDDENDHWMIKKGIDWFNKSYPDLKPAYNGIPVP